MIRFNIKYSRWFKLVLIYVMWLLVFALQKPLFMGWYHDLYVDASFSDWLAVMWNGLKLDASIAGYLTIIPGLLLIVSIWIDRPWVRIAMKTYFVIMSVLVAIIFVTDMGLYEFWGFRLDATPLFYLFSSPKDAFASVSWLYILMGLFAIFLTSLLIYGAFKSLKLWQARNMSEPLSSSQTPLRGESGWRKAMAESVVLFFLTALLFIPIRGGFTVSTMNTGKVFFSTDMRLNHAALNPAFNLMESFSKQTDFANQYRFMPDDEATTVVQTMLDEVISPSHLAGVVNTPSHSILDNHSSTTNVLMIILESFSSKLMTSLGGEPGVAINLDSLAQQGVLFTHFYANSFRTDRGLVSILSGYPAQPTTSLMKYPRKTQNLPGICRSLKQAGYTATYYYGGDADFTNMRSYLMAQGFVNIISDVDFPISERLSKWGAHDEVVFNRLLQDLTEEANSLKSSAGYQEVPWFKVLQTSSSHEPFEVPYHRLENQRLNAFAYTDECVGNFIRSFRQLPQWEHTLVVLVPDHLGGYPENISNFTPERYQIPLIFTGGAVKSPMEIDVIGSQHDIAATLLAQMGLPHEEFIFSKDMLNPNNPHFAFFTVPDAFGLVSEENTLIFDNQAGKVVWDEGIRKGTNLRKGQAYLQKLYDDIDKR